MENISRALIIAGEVLIAVAVLSIFALVITKFGSFSSDIHSEMSDTQIGAYNQNFYKMDGRINITSQEIATIINFAKEQNDEREISYNNLDNSPYYIDVIIDNNSFFSKYNNEASYNDKELFKQKVNEFLSANNFDYYSCNATATVQSGTIDYEKKCKILVKSTSGDINVSNVTGLVNSIKFSKVSLSKNWGSSNKTINYNVGNKDYFEITTSQ